jgi:hypothetical protein
MSRPKGCLNCGKPFSKPLNPNGIKAKFCSRRCKSVYHIHKKRGYK